MPVNKNTKARLQARSELTSTSEGKWRPCPAGQYWRRAHYQSTYTTRSGKTVKGHYIRAGCCENPSRKDQIYSEELTINAKKFMSLKGPPTDDYLGFGKRGNQYDELIRGWTQFWNETLSPKDPLDPNLIKALIATESGFVADPKRNRKIARGLMQITEIARKSLGGFKNELKDHLVHVDKKDITDPVLNIAAGIRWLHHKKYLAEHRLNRQVTWDEAVAEYKDYLVRMLKDSHYLPRPIKDFRKYYKELSK